MKFLSSKSGSCVGLDIGSSAVKCVELTGSLRSPKIKIWGIEPIPSGSIEEGAIVEHEKVISALNSLLARSRVKTKDVALAISSSHAITKVVQMASDLSENDLEDMVESEAAHFVPYSIDDVNLDFQILGKNSENPEQQDVLIAACRTDIIDDYVSIIQEAGLEPKIVDIDTFAIERLYLTENPSVTKDQIMAIFDIGVNSTKLIVFQGDEMIFNRQQKFGGSQLITLVRQEYGLSAEEAMALLESESPPTDIEEKVFKPFFTQTASELSRGLQFFYSSSGHNKLTKALFTGGVSNLPNFSTEVATRMSINGGNLSQYGNFSISGDRDALLSRAGRLSVATGLAIRGISA